MSKVFVVNSAGHDLSAAQPFENLNFLVQVVGRDADGHRLADDFLGGVAKQPFAGKSGHNFGINSVSR